jgi:hypothetical protein
MKFTRTGRPTVLALLFTLVTLLPAVSSASVAITVAFAPPVLPVYEQPLCPEAGLIWTPGYWAYGDGDYYWVPGAWEPAPFVGALWTPPYWGWSGGQYIFYLGYWGLTVGFYGGVNYGFGYMGIGYVGGMWRGGVFSYNTAVTRVNTTIIHNTYNDNAIVRQNTIANANRVAYSGGPGGVRHSPTAAERTAMTQRHTPPTKFQEQQAAQARANRSSFAKVNGGHPQTLTVAHPQTTERAAGANAANRSETTRKTTATHSNETAGRQEPRGATANGAAHGATHTAPAEGAKTETRGTTRTETQRTTAARAEHETKPAAGAHERTTSRNEETTHVTPRETRSTESARAEGSTHVAPRSETHVKTAAPAAHESKPAISSRPETAPHSEPYTRAETHPAPEVREPRSAPAPKPAPAPSTHAAPAPAPHETHPAPESKTAAPPAHQAEPTHEAPAPHAAPAGHKPE